MKQNASKFKPNLAIAALGGELPVGAAPSDVRLFPAGEFRAVDGRPADCAAWVMTEEDGQRLVAAANARSSDYLIDYEHQTLRAEANGQPAPASGWFKQLEWRAGDGLYMVGVNWTAAAADHIAGREYRYISPVFSYDKTTGRVLKIFHAALTNNPGLDGLTDLAALAAQFLSSDQPLQETSMDLLKKLLAAIGLQDTATEAEALSAVTTLKSKADAVSGLEGKVEALSAQVATPDPSKFAPVAALTALQVEKATLQGQVAALSAEINDGKLDKVISDGLAAGKLTPATEAWARDLGKSNLAQLCTFIDAAPVVVAPGETQTGGKKPNGGVDANDPAVIAEAALKHQVEQAAAGVNLSTVQAVSFVTKKGA